MHEKEKQDLGEFSWTNLFLVTGLSFLLFSGLLTLLHGDRVNLFFYTGVASTICGVLGLLNKWTGVLSQRREQAQ